jgi:hypothetical protein
MLLLLNRSKGRSLKLYCLAFSRKSASAQTLSSSFSRGTGSLATRLIPTYYQGSNHAKMPLAIFFSRGLRESKPGNS